MLLFLAVATALLLAEGEVNVLSKSELTAPFLPLLLLSSREMTKA